MYSTTVFHVAFLAAPPEVSLNFLSYDLLVSVG